MATERWAGVLDGLQIERGDESSPAGYTLRLASGERIGRLRCPVVVVAGEPDSVVPTELSRRLFEAANEPKRLLVYPGYDHNDDELSRGELWIDDVAAFLRETGVLGD